MKKLVGIVTAMAFVVLSFLYSVTAGAVGSTFFVRTDGSDSVCNGSADVADTVSAEPNCAFKTIQHALDTAATGDTVKVDNGTYNESPNITKAVTLQSVNGRANTTISLQTGPTYLGSVTIAASNVTVDGFTITGYDGVGSASGSTNILVNSTLSNVSITNNRLLVGARNPDDNSCSCVIDQGFGILTTYTEDPAALVNSVTVTGNIFSPAHTQGTRAFYVNPGVDTFSFQNNQITGTFTGTALSQAKTTNAIGNTITGTGAAGSRSGGIGVWGAPNPAIWGHGTFQNNTISGVRNGIILYSANNVTISNNDFSQVGNGVNIDVGDPSDPVSDPTTIAIHNNKFNSQDTNAVVNALTTGGPVNATTNWWGTANGPTNPSNTFNKTSQGGTVSGNVTFVPWWSTVSGTPGSFTGTSFAPVTTTNPAGGQFSSIQAAVTAAPNGTVTAAAGTFTEQVTITKSLTLTGNGAANTTIRAPATLSTDADGKKNIVEFRGGVTDTMSGFTVLGPGPGGCGSIDTGIAALGGATLNLSATSVTSIRDNPLSGCQNGEGIRVGTPRGGSASTGTLNASNVTITDFQKNGITLSGTGTQGTIDHATVTGAGPTTFIAQNGIQVGSGATATLTNNQVSGMECNHTSCGADPITQTQSTGILLLNPDGGMTIQNNTVSNNDIGIYNLVTANESTGPTPTKAGSGSGKHAFSASDPGQTTSGPTRQAVNTGPTKISGNTLTNNRYEGLVFDEGTATASGNTITGGNIGVESVSYTGSTGNSFGTLTGNHITGASVAGIQLQTDAPTGTQLAGVIGDTNDISGNTKGVNNTTTNTVTLTNNWWGNATGPTHSTNPAGTGNSVTDHVTFSPWCSTSACTAFFGIPTKLVVVTQPGNATALSAFGTQPVVQAQDAAGHLGINFAGGVTAAIGTNPASGVLSGTNPVTASAGVATFTNLALDKPGTGYTLAFSASGLTSATSNAFNVAAPGPTISAISPASGGLAGQNSVTITGTGFVPGVTVTFGSTPGTNVTIVSTTSLTVTVPAATSAGKVDVHLANGSVQGGTLTQGYEYVTSDQAPSTSGRPQPPVGVQGQPNTAPDPRTGTPNTNPPGR